MSSVKPDLWALRDYLYFHEPYFKYDKKKEKLNGSTLIKLPETYMTNTPKHVPDDIVV